MDVKQQIMTAIGLGKDQSVYTSLTYKGAAASAARALAAKIGEQKLGIAVENNMVALATEASTEVTASDEGFLPFCNFWSVCEKIIEAHIDAAIFDSKTDQQEIFDLAKGEIKETYGLGQSHIEKAADPVKRTGAAQAAG